MPDDPTTREMQLDQIQREVREREQAGDAIEPGDERAHERRADRAAYLKGKLTERAKSEEET